MTVEQARQLISTTYDIVRSPITGRQLCESLNEREETFKLLRSAFLSDDPTVGIVVSTDKGFVNVARDEYFLRFKRVDPDTPQARFEYECWSFWIVVD